MTDRLTLALSDQIVAAALAEARARDAQPLCIAVLDAGAHLVALKREDDASLLRPQIAVAKAAGALGLGMGTREIARRAAGNPAFFNSLFAVSDGAMAASPGGVLIRRGGRIIGAVGISGDTGDLDEACAVAGILAAALAPDVGHPPPAV